MSKRSKPYSGYEEKEWKRKHRQKAFDRSFSGTLTDLMITGIFTIFSLAVAAVFTALSFAVCFIRWVFEQMWIAVKCAIEKVKGSLRS